MFDPRSFAPVRGVLPKMTTRLRVLSCEFRGDFTKATDEAPLMIANVR
jgi:hypothetical protein